MPCHQHCLRVNLLVQRYKKIAEEFEHAKMPLPTIEETGGGVMAIIQRETMDEVIAKTGRKCRRHVGN